jgi:hypothetical protein
MKNNNFRLTVTRITDIELTNTAHYSHANPDKVWFHHLEIALIDAEGNRTVIDVHSEDGNYINIHGMKFDECKTVVA